MKKIWLVGLTILTVGLWSNLCFTQNSYIREGSIGEQPEEKQKKTIFSFRPISSWEGERFIFLPQPKSSQKYGYQAFQGRNENYSHSRYSEYVGRIAKVISVKKADFLSYDVTFKMEDNGKKFTKRIPEFDSIMGIAPVVDIDNARKRWLGKTLWYTKESIVTYDANTEDFGSIKVEKYSPVKVIDIVAGWHEHSPVRFIIQTDGGQQGFVDVTISGTNVSKTLRDFSRFKNYFSETSPKKEIYKEEQKKIEKLSEKKKIIARSIPARSFHNDYFYSKLKIGSWYRISEKTALMPELNPVDPLAAIEKIKYILPGAIIKVINMKWPSKNANFPWYYVEVKDKLDGYTVGKGWINSIQFP